MFLSRSYEDLNKRSDQWGDSFSYRLDIRYTGSPRQHQGKSSIQTSRWLHWYWSHTAHRWQSASKCPWWFLQKEGGWWTSNRIVSKIRCTHWNYSIMKQGTIIIFSVSPIAKLPLQSKQTLSTVALNYWKTLKTHPQKDTYLCRWFLLDPKCFQENIRK